MIDIAKLESSFQGLLERGHIDLWFTGTFDVVTDEYAAVKITKGFFKNLNKPNDVYFKKYLDCWICVEKPPWSDRAHVHVLIQGIDPAFAMDVALQWVMRFGTAKVEPYDYTLERRAAEYLAEKYSLGWLRSYDLCRINSRWRTHKKVY